MATIDSGVFFSLFLIGLAYHPLVKSDFFFYLLSFLLSLKACPTLQTFGSEARLPTDTLLNHNSSKVPFSSRFLTNRCIVFFFGSNLDFLVLAVEHLEYVD
uniref:Uncharacterized protein n=1 Tax=Panagrolaimus sp. JU765 TaxID=591449 RepID=A0AC34QSV8_9BILA